jgi:hypothetical protein
MKERHRRAMANMDERATLLTSENENVFPQGTTTTIQGRWQGKFARDPTNPSRTNKLYSRQPKLLIKQRIKFCKFLTGDGVAPAGAAWILAGKVVSRESSDAGGMRALLGWRCSYDDALGMTQLLAVVASILTGKAPSQPAAVDLGRGWMR